MSVEKMLCFIPLFCFGCSVSELDDSELTEKKNQSIQDSDAEIVENDILRYQCDTIYPEQKILVQLSISKMETDSDDNNVLFEFIRGSDTLYSDSLFSEQPEIQFKDMNKDGVSDILIHYYEGARSSNQSYHLYLVDPNTFIPEEVIGFEEIWNPSFNDKYNVIESYSFSGEDYFSFYQLNDNKIGDMNIHIVDDHRMHSHKDVEQKIENAMALFSNGPYTIKVITETNPDSKFDKYSFPCIQGPNKSTCDRINNSISQEMLHLNMEEKNESIFEKVWETDDDPVPELTFMDFRIERFDSKIYSVTIEAEGCGAYCEFFDRTFNFDMRNGNRIELNSVFTAKGKEKMLKRISADKSSMVHTKIENVRDSLDTNLYDPNMVSHYKDMVEMYEMCYLDYDNLDYIDFIPFERGITIKLGRCSVHIDQCLDDLGDFEFDYFYDQIENDLNDLGKYLFS